MRLFSIAAGLGLVLIPLAGFAADAPEPTATQPFTAAQPVSAAQAADPVSCRILFHQGTLVRREICATAHEWERQRLLQQRLLREFQIRALSDPM